MDDLSASGITMMWVTHGETDAYSGGEVAALEPARLELDEQGRLAYATVSQQDGLKKKIMTIIEDNSTGRQPC